MSINQWGTNGNAAFAIPMEQATPTLPSSQQYMLAWDTTLLLLRYVPCSIDYATGNITTIGNITLPADKVVKVGLNQVLAARRTGWADPTGTEVRTTFVTSTVTLEQLAQRFFALYTDLKAHGLIGA